MARRVAAGSAAEFPEKVRHAASMFGAAVGPLLRARVGQAEANLTGPVEHLLGRVAGALKLTLLTHREAAYRSLGARPDLAVDVAGVRVGVVELKAPGMGVPGGARWGKARDRAQWDKLRLLPNVLYTDGSTWAVYHYGECAAISRLEGDLATAGSRLRPADEAFSKVLQDFLYWEPDPPRDLASLIRISAGLCQLLRDEVTEALLVEGRGIAKAFFSEHLADWQEWLFPDLTPAEFADAYAQTVTFGLMLARREGVGFEGLEIPDIGERLAKQHLLVGRALSILTARPDRGASIEERSIVLQTMRRVIGVADWTTWPAAGTYHWLYEEFLEAYDPAIRRRTGAYYTPRPVADFMTRFADEVLIGRLNVNRGLANEQVVVLDPAMGTGTFLQSIVDRVANLAGDDGGDVPAALRDLLKRLIGFERQIGPYAVAELKINQALEAHNAEAKDEDLRLYVADTLDDPNKLPLPVRARMYAPLADSRRSANEVKTTEPVMVVIGNPPYRAKAKSLGRWVVDKHPGRRSLLDDFREVGNGKYEYKLHDLAVYFWRWALWKVFESNGDHPGGVVAFITTSAFLDGPGFAGMRRYLRKQADFGWIIDMSPEGHWSNAKTRVFPEVPHPVCIAIFARRCQPQPDTPALIKYVAIEGEQSRKFEALNRVHVENSVWLDCPSGWTTPLLPIQSGTWTSYPMIDDIFPCTSTGVMPNRTWVHAPHEETLMERWQTLVTANPAEQRILVKETRDRKIAMTMPKFPGEPDALPLISETSATPRVSAYAFRSFDRQYLIKDRRVVDALRSDLWRINNERQVYLVTQLRQTVSGGPAAVFTALVPDVDHFQGSHGGRILPLFRDVLGVKPNIAPQLAELLGERLGFSIQDGDLMAYVAAIISHPGYTRRFDEQLRQPGIRVPLTTAPDRWEKAVALGKQIIWIHTFGAWLPKEVTEDFNYDQIRKRRPRVSVPIPGTEDRMPENIGYDDANAEIVVGEGRIGPVSRRAWEYEVNGMPVIRHWFDYRKANPPFPRKGTDLDRINPRAWSRSTTEELRLVIATLESCIALEPVQDELLSSIIQGPLLTVCDLEAAAILPVDPSAQKIIDNNLEGRLA